VNSIVCRGREGESFPTQLFKELDPIVIVFCEMPKIEEESTET